MDPIIYFGVLIVSFLSILIGSYIAYETEEELKPGKKHFIYTYYFFLLILIYMIAKIFSSSIIIFIAIFVVILVLLKVFKLKFKNFILFSIFLYLSSTSYSFPIVASLIFILGLITGTMTSSKYIISKKKHNLVSIFVHQIKDYFLFFVIGSILFFI